MSLSFEKPPVLYVSRHIFGAVAARGETGMFFEELGKIVYVRNAAVLGNSLHLQA